MYRDYKNRQSVSSYINNEEYDEEEEFDTRVKSFPVKPMSVEEAILQMNLLGHNFYIFKIFICK